MINQACRACPVKRPIVGHRAKSRDKSCLKLKCLAAIRKKSDTGSPTGENCARAVNARTHYLNKLYPTKDLTNRIIVLRGMLSYLPRLGSSKRLDCCF